MQNQNWLGIRILETGFRLEAANHRDR